MTEDKAADHDIEMAAKLRVLADRVERGEQVLVVLGVYDEESTNREIHGTGTDTILLGLVAGLMLDAQRMCD